MKANELIKNKGIQYAIEIVKNAPESVSAWNEGYEFTCGQAVNISDEDREKYFVDMADLKRLVDSWELVIVWRMPESWRDEYDGDVFGLEGARMYLDMFGNHELVGEELERFKQAIADVESCQ